MSLSTARGSASSSDAAAKRQKLKGIVGLKGVSSSALAAILERTHREGIEPASRWQIGSLLKNEFSQVRHTIELELQEGGSFTWEVCRVDSLMQYFVNECETFKQGLAGAVRSARAMPLRTAWYLDEIVPGNVLRPDNNRKFWAFYMGFEDLPRHRLGQEQWWLPIAVLRSRVASSVVGGLSHCFKVLLKSALFEPCRLATVGFALTLDEPVLVRIRSSSVIGDESALKGFWKNKGASGTKPCLFCGNLVAMQSGLAEDNPRLIDVSCCDHRRFQVCNDSDIWEAFDRLGAVREGMSNRDFGMQEQAAGLNYHPQSILADRQLRNHIGPISSTKMDWMHNLCVGGVASVEIHLFLERCRGELGVRYADLEVFAQADWRWPAWQGNHKVPEVFSKSRERASSDHFRAGASEILQVFPLIRDFALAIVRPTQKLELEVRSLLGVCAVLDCLLAAKHTHQDHGTLEATRAFLQAHIAAYGKEGLKPKHHYIFHNALQASRGEVMDCFVHERKHQVLKAAANPVKNTRAFESSILGRVLLEQTRQMKASPADRGLVQPVPAEPALLASLGVGAASMGREIRRDGLQLAAGDLVIFGKQAGFVQCGVEAEGLLLALVQPLTQVSVAPSSSTWDSQHQVGGGG